MERKGAGRAVAEATEAPLRLERAFVVQLREQPDPAANLFVGRAEHLVSGTSERFTCAADLLAFITKVLATRFRSQHPRGVVLDAAAIAARRRGT